MLTTLRQLPRTVWLIGLVSLVNDGASEMVYPLLPLVLTSVLMAGPKALGLIEGIAEATGSLLKLVSGALRDRGGRSRPWILAGYGLAALARPLIALASSWPVLLVLRFADRIGKGLRSSPRDALLANAVADHQRGLAFGLHRALDNAGAVLGPLAAAGLLKLQLSPRQIIAWSLLPGLLCLVLASALREPREPREAEGSREAGPAAPSRAIDWRFAALPPPLQRFLPVLALFTLSNSSNLFLLLRARELGLTAAQIPLLWASISAVAMVASTPLSAWSDRVGRRRLLVGGYAAYGLFYLAIARLQHGGPALLPLMASYGLFLAATEGVEKALVADLSPPGQRGTAFGWFHLVSGLMVLPASLGFGWLYERFDSAVAFTGAGACALVAAAWLSKVRLVPGDGAP